MTQSESKVVFFDLTPELLDRYPKFVADRFYKSRKCVFMSMAELIELNRGADWDKFWFNVDEVVVCGHRLPDIILSLLAAEKGISVSYIQHGIFDRRLKRTALGVVRLLTKKGADYWSVYRIYKNKRKLALGFWLFLAAFYDNRFVRKAMSVSSGIGWKSMFLNRSSSLAEFEEILGFSQLNPRVVFIDFDESRFCFGNEKDTDVVIFLQTFVEDGRMDKGAYIERLKSVVCKARLEYEKVSLYSHPRSEVSLYEGVLELDGVDWVENHEKVPHAKLFLSDYSSMLLVAKNLGFKVRRVRISGHTSTGPIEEIESYS